MEALWTAQMFLTNGNRRSSDSLLTADLTLTISISISCSVFLFPYMALRLNAPPPPPQEQPPTAPASIQSVFRNGLAKNANSIGWIGGVVGLVSLAWFAVGRHDASFGSVAERWQYLLHYIGSDRPAYAFVWDMGLYTAFQAWLIKDNMEGRDELMEKLRFLPFFGLAVYLITRPASPKQ